MHLSRNRKIALIGGGAAVIGLGVVAAPVIAKSVPGLHAEDGDHGEFAKDLASKLGVPQSKVDKALDSMQGDHLARRVDELQSAGRLSTDQASAIKAKIAAGDVQGAFKDLRAAMIGTETAALVKAGTITQDQADQIAALVQAGVPLGLRVPPPGATGQKPPQHVESAAHQKSQVQQLQQAGAIDAAKAKEITDLIDAGKTADAETAIHAALDAGMLKQLVKDGVVTQAQADQVAALIAAGVPVGIGGPGGHGPGDHRPGDHGPGMGGDHDGDHGMGGDMDGDHGMGGPPPSDGQQGGQFQQQSYGDSASGA